MSKLLSLKILDFVEGDEATQFSQVFEDGFLFDLTDDESELYNLLNPALPHYDEALNMEIIEKWVSVGGVYGGQ